MKTITLRLTVSRPRKPPGNLIRTTPPTPRGGEGAQGPRGPLGKIGPWGPLGLFRSHSEWQVIPEPVRMERPFRMDGSSEWKAIPCVHSAAKTPNRMPADLFGWIWTVFIRFKLILWIWSAALAGFERICLDLTELGWISADLIVRIWVHF